MATRTKPKPTPKQVPSTAEALRQLARQLNREWENGDRSAHISLADLIELLVRLADEIERR